MYATITHHWYLILSPVILIAAFILLAWIAGSTIRLIKKLVSFRLKLLFFVSDRLEPDSIATFRCAVSKTFDELNEFLEKSKFELLRSRMDNVAMKDKIAELERSRKALIQELGGFSDSLGIEFSIWEKVTQVLGFLVSDRLVLLQTLEEAYGENTMKLLDDLSSLKKENQAAEQKNKSLTKDISGLQRQNTLLFNEKMALQANVNELQARVDRLQSKDEEYQAIAKTQKSLKKEVSNLEETKATLQKQLAESKHEVEELKLYSDNFIIISDLQTKNEGLHKSCKKHKEKIFTLESELSQKKAQVKEKEAYIKRLSERNEGLYEAWRNCKKYKVKRRVIRSRRYIYRSRSYRSQ